MYIQEVHIRNFRSIREATLQCGSVTSLVGRNGSGKSSFLSAIQMFYDSSAVAKREDFYDEDVSKDIEITVTFVGLDREAERLFASYVHDDVLAIVRVFSFADGNASANYHGVRLQNVDFVSVRNSGGAMDVRRSYIKLRERSDYSGLPTANSLAAVLEALDQWEADNPDRCSRIRDDGRFFGFKQVAEGYIGRFTRFVHVPAVRDAQEDATDSKGSPVTQIMDLVVRNALSRDDELADFQQRTQAQYKELMAPGRIAELKGLEGGLSSTLQSYVAEASVHIEWFDFDQITVPLPRAQVKLQEDGYWSTVERTGHGLQRAFIITMFQYLVGANTSDISRNGRSESFEGGNLPGLFLAIEEPELYQHPSRQRHLSAVLTQLARDSITGVAETTQVIYSTHSPLLIGLDRFDQIRAIRKTTKSAEEPKITHVIQADMKRVAEELWHARTASHQAKFTTDTLRPRLQAILTPWMNEGFFANVVVLVEGEDDRAAILGVANSMDINFDSLGISLIPCFGKSNLDRPLVIFRQLGIPVFVIWDSDRGKRDADAELNRYMLRLQGQPEEDWPCFVRESCACFKVNMEATLEGEIGSELFNRLLLDAQKEYEIPKREQALKNVAAIRHVVEQSAICGQHSASLQQIVRNIRSLST